ncbi:exported hypothetical protein [Desulfamplus magnetovallimortis]|uniref:SCP domain-containing protein n=1 Tax=Desulfamplus magnetovallimortis TaxID=1246637 RepID=A0A1W1HDB5_9BACT|nr:CAP domain-containing protein [Desulfamplus magnetovallimortis]SLM30365.1 exported hypothetical protein [Desulfamplus magnetovallimortis]
MKLKFKSKYSIKSNIAGVALCFSILLFGSFDVSAFSDDDAEAYLWKLINEARSRPSAAVDAWDIDKETAKEALGENSWILDLKSGLPPLAWNPMLADSASAHNLDMIERYYYSYTSPEGDGVKERVSRQGYIASETGETLGILSFYLYVDPMEAVEDIFSNMIRDELDPAPGYSKNIFSTAFTEIGISFVSTQFSFDEENPFNAYVVTVDFAKPSESRSYILGNIYNSTAPVPVEQQRRGDYDSGPDYAGNLISYKKWLPEYADYSFKIMVENMTEKWLVEVPHSALAGYQIEIPVGTYYKFSLFSNNDETPVEKIVDYGRNENIMLDFDLGL